MCVGTVEVVTVEPSVHVEFVRLVLGLGITAIALRFLKVVRFIN
jgi:hypothetical protein